MGSVALEGVDEPTRVGVVAAEEGATLAGHGCLAKAFLVAGGVRFGAPALATERADVREEVFEGASIKFAVEFSRGKGSAGVLCGHASFARAGDKVSRVHEIRVGGQLHGGGGIGLAAQGPAALTDGANRAFRATIGLGGGGGVEERFNAHPSEEVGQVVRIEFAVAADVGDAERRVDAVAVLYGELDLRAELRFEAVGRVLPMFCVGVFHDKAVVLAGGGSHTIGAIAVDGHDLVDAVSGEMEMVGKGFLGDLCRRAAVAEELC